MEGYTEIERPAGYPESTEELVFWCFCEWMNKKYGNKVNQNKLYGEAVQEMIYGILSSEEGELTVIPASMGVGKSTLLMVFAKFMAINDPEFGCIIVKERIEDMDLLAEQLGYFDDEYAEQKICFAWKGYNVKSCIKGHKEYRKGLCSECNSSICEVKIAPKEQKRYPVLVITHERLFRLSNTEDMLSNLKEWTDEYGNIHERKYIFIDEQPKFFEIYKENWVRYQTFIEELNRISQIARIDLNTDKLELALKDLLLNMPNKEARLPRDSSYMTCQEALNELKTIEKAWWKQSPDSLSSLFPFFRDYFANRGYRDGETITTYQYTDYTFESYRTVVMDGTANENLSYPPKSRIVEIEDFRTYENLMIHHYEGTNLSKSKLRSNPREYLLKLVDDIKDISSANKTLVVISKEFREILEELLEDLPNIEIAHFNSLKGTNKYRDCTAIFFAGTMDFGDEYYILKAIAVDKEKISSFNIDTIDKVRTFESDFINQVKLNSSIIYLLQDIFRVSVRNDDGLKRQNHVYLFNTNKEVIESLMKRLPGCQYKQWKPSHELQNKSPNEKKLLDCIDKHFIKSGDIFDKKNLRLEMGMKDEKEFRLLFRRAYIQQELTSRGITGWESGNYSRILRKL